MLVVDGVTRVAAATPFPFWRDLRPGDAGPDVKMLQSLMTDLGFYGGAATGQVDRATSDAVSKWGNSLGDTTGTSLFDRSWVIWLPVDVFKIERLDVQTGASAPPPGAAIAVAAAQLLSVSLLTQSDEPVGITDPAAWQVQLGSRVAGLAASQPVRVLEADLQRVADQFDADAKTTPAVITTKTPRSVVVVPASSVGSNADGGTCVWVPGDDGYMPVPVRVAGGSFNTAQLASGLPAASTVLVNPGEVLANPTCPSS
ncbi:MAG: peptidoglycan-binding domain-containing protein [Chloroflexota bacterium]